MTETRRTQYDGQQITSSLSGWAIQTNKEEVRLDNQPKLKTSDIKYIFHCGLYPFTVNVRFFTMINVTDIWPRKFYFVVNMLNRN